MSVTEDMKSALAMMMSQLRTTTEARSYGIRMDTAANLIFVMGRRQYEAYNREFVFRVPIRATKRNALREI